MKTVLIALVCLLTFSGNVLFSLNAAHAQSVFINDGVIEYEKSVNMFTMLPKIYPPNMPEAMLKSMMDSYRRTQPQFMLMTSNLSFSGGKTLYEPVVPTGRPMQLPYPETQQNNIIYTDAAAKTSISQKVVYEQTFLVKDAARQIKWKVTDEMREIAGFNCRRANGLMLDSIYVVAFYTDDIPVSGGPESFRGLPGMILGVALPDEHITWFAKKVQVKPASPIKAPEKGKVVTNQELKTTLETSLRSRGAQAKNLIKAFLL